MQQTVGCCCPCRSFVCVRFLFWLVLFECVKWMCRYYVPVKELWSVIREYIQLVSGSTWYHIFFLLHFNVCMWKVSWCAWFFSVIIVVVVFVIVNADIVIRNVMISTEKYDKKKKRKKVCSMCTNDSRHGFRCMYVCVFALVAGRSLILSLFIHMHQTWATAEKTMPSI